MRRDAASLEDHPGSPVISSSDVPWGNVNLWENRPPSRSRRQQVSEADSRLVRGGVAVLDYDHDGKMDIFFTNGAKYPELTKTSLTYFSCLLRNKGDGTFED